MIFATECIPDGETIGLAGVGTMGKCMLNGLLNGGYQVVAYDPFPPAREYAAAHGAAVAESPAELAEKAKVIYMSLPKPQHVLDVVNGENGLMKNLTGEHIVVDTSTVDPETSRTCAGIVAEKGAHYIDAPVLGRPSAAGKWLMPAGGERECVEYLQPVFSCFAQKAVHVGDHGAGNVFKLLNQIMFSVINGVSAEVMALTDVLGVDKKVFFDVVSKSGAATVSGLFCETAGRIADERYDDPTFTVELLCKDAGLGIQMAKDAGVTPLIGSYVQQINEHVRDEEGLAKKDTSAVVNYFRELYSGK